MVNLRVTGELTQSIQIWDTKKTSHSGHRHQSPVECGPYWDLMEKNFLRTSAHPKQYHISGVFIYFGLMYLFIINTYSCAFLFNSIFIHNGKKNWNDSIYFITYLTYKQKSFSSIWTSGQMHTQTHIKSKIKQHQHNKIKTTKKPSWNIPNSTVIFEEVFFGC